MDRVSERAARKARYRREWLLTFSPGEMVWLTAFMAVFLAILL